MVFYIKICLSVSYTKNISLSQITKALKNPSTGGKILLNFPLKLRSENRKCLAKVPTRLCRIHNCKSLLKMKILHCYPLLNDHDPSTLSPYVQIP